MTIAEHHLLAEAPAFFAPSASKPPAFHPSSSSSELPDSPTSPPPSTREPIISTTPASSLPLLAAAAQQVYLPPFPSSLSSPYAAQKEMELVPPTRTASPAGSGLAELFPSIGGVFGSSGAEFGSVNGSSPPRRERSSDRVAVSPDRNPEDPGHAAVSRVTSSGSLDGSNRSESGTPALEAFEGQEAANLLSSQDENDAEMAAVAILGAGEAQKKWERERTPTPTKSSFPLLASSSYDSDEDQPSSMFPRITGQTPASSRGLTPTKDRPTPFRSPPRKSVGPSPLRFQSASDETTSEFSYGNAEDWARKQKQWTPPAMDNALQPYFPRSAALKARTQIALEAMDGKSLRPKPVIPKPALSKARPKTLIPKKLAPIPAGAVRTLIPGRSFVSALTLSKKPRTPQKMILKLGPSIAKKKPDPVSTLLPRLIELRRKKWNSERIRKEVQVVLGEVKMKERGKGMVKRTLL